MRILSPNSSGNVFPIQGPTANTNVEAARRFVAAEGHVVQPPAVRSPEGGARDPDLAPLHLEPLGHGFDGPPRPHDARVGFVEPEGDPLLRPDPGPAVVDLVHAEQLVVDPEPVPLAHRVFEIGDHLLAQDEIAGLIEDPRQEEFLSLLVPLDPAPDGLVGPAIPHEALRAPPVGGPDAARFPARGGARVARAVGVEHGHGGPEPDEVERRPDPEVSGADHDDVGGLAGGASHGNRARGRRRADEGGCAAERQSGRSRAGRRALQELPSIDHQVARPLPKRVNPAPKRRQS